MIEEMSRAGSIEGMAKPPKDLLMEKQWDMERVKECAGCLQMAVEMLLIVLPEGSLRDRVSAAAVQVTSYKRRFQYVIAKVSLSLRGWWVGADVPDLMLCCR
jgi:hypothetical protein